LKQIQASGSSTAGGVFDPAQLAQLLPAIAAGIRHGLADALHPVFMAGLPIIAVAFIATLFIKELPCDRQPMSRLGVGNRSRLRNESRALN
jgi:hypothetical protein